MRSRFEPRRYPSRQSFARLNTSKRSMEHMYQRMRDSTSSKRVEKNYVNIKSNSILI